MFSEAEKEFLKSIGINADFSKVSDDEFVTIEEKVSIHLKKLVLMKTISRQKKD